MLFIIALVNLSSKTYYASIVLKLQKGQFWLEESTSIVKILKMTILNFMNLN